MRYYPEHRYTLFAEHVFKGLPVVRPLWFDHMSDTALYESADTVHVSLK